VNEFEACKQASRKTIVITLAYIMNHDSIEIVKPYVHFSSTLLLPFPLVLLDENIP